MLMDTVFATLVLFTICFVSILILCTTMNLTERDTGIRMRFAIATVLSAILLGTILTIAVSSA